MFALWVIALAVTGLWVYNSIKRSPSELVNSRVGGELVGRRPLESKGRAMPRAELIVVIDRCNQDQEIPAPAVRAMYNLLWCNANAPSPAIGLVREENRAALGWDVLLTQIYQVLMDWNYTALNYHEFTKGENILGRIVPEILRPYHASRVNSCSAIYGDGVSLNPILFHQANPRALRAEHGFLRDLIALSNLAPLEGSEGGVCDKEHNTYKLNPKHSVIVPITMCVVGYVLALWGYWQLRFGRTGSRRRLCLGASAMFIGWPLASIGLGVFLVRVF
jgi:hypothetical protein